MTPSTLTDLLPDGAARAARRDYFLRLATIGVVVLILMVIAHGALLLPTYQYLKHEVAERTAALSRMNDELITGGDAAATDRLAAVRANATYLAGLGGTPAAAGVLRLVLAVPRSGVRITAFSYELTEEGETEKLGITGVASTREALRNYDLALSSAAWAKKVDLPISAYAEEANIPFTISITGDFTTP